MTLCKLCQQNNFGLAVRWGRGLGRNAHMQQEQLRNVCVFIFTRPTIFANISVRSHVHGCVYKCLWIVYKMCISLRVGVRVFVRDKFKSDKSRIPIVHRTRTTICLNNLAPS